MAKFYDTSSKWGMRCFYFFFAPCLLFAQLQGVVIKDPLDIPDSALWTFFIISTSCFLLCRVCFFKVKRSYPRFAQEAILYESLYLLFYIALVLCFCFGIVAYIPLSYAFSTAVTLQVCVAIGGTWFVQKRCRIVWNNGLFNSNSKRWNFDKMRYSVCELRLYKDSWSSDLNKKSWEPGMFLTGLMVLVFCVFFALMIHKKDGHSGSLILTLLFRNNPTVGNLANSILVFVIGQIALWFMLIPCFILRLLEIIKIRQIEKEKGVRMLVKEKKIFKNL